MNEIEGSLTKKRSASLSQFWPMLLIGLIWLVFFWPMMTGQTVVGFRDSAYLYYPYFKWIDQQWAAGQIPLWNPYCDLGHPVIADGTSSVFYPGKLIFLLRFLSYPSRYGIYISFHVLLAAGGAYGLAKRLGANSTGATLAAVSYAFGGSVLFQTTNVVFLVSAALLPFAFMYLWKMYRHRESHNAILVGLWCALMILGGDPQMGYVVGLIGIALFFGKVNRRRRFGTNKPIFGKQVSLARFCFFGCRQLAICLVTTLALSAVQVLPTYIWANQSSRVDVNNSNYLEMFDRLEPGSPTEATYQFSQPPWTVVELFCPNIFGKPFPINQRWTGHLPGAERIWTPSLYVGLLTLLLAFTGMRLGGKRRINVWLTRLAIFFAVASFGWYGAVWFYNEIAIGLGFQELTGIGRPVGGVYWAMLALFPKFYLFRYPAKLFVVSSLAICILAALSLGNKRKTSNVIPVWIPIVLIALASGALVFLNQTNLLQSLNFSDPFFGPFDNDGAFVSTNQSLLQLLIVSLLLATICCWSMRLPARTVHANKCRVVLLLFAVAELLIANAWLAPQVDATVFEKQTQLGSLISGLKKSQCNDSLHLQLVRTSDPEFDWRNVGSEHRLAEIVTWQRETLHPKHNLLEGCQIIGSFSSIESTANRNFVDSYFRERSRRTGLDAEYLDRMQDSVSSNRTEQIGWPSYAKRIWFLPDRQNLTQIDQRCWDAWAFPEKEPAVSSSSKKYAIVEKSNNRFVIGVDTADPATLVFNSLPSPGWTIRVNDLRTGESHDDCQFDASEFFVVANIPEGQLQIEILYDPDEFWFGAWISAIAWTLLVILFVKNRLG